MLGRLTILLLTALHIGLHAGADVARESAVSEMLRRIKIRQCQNARCLAGCVPVSRSQRQSVIDYIREQREHHRQRSFKEEFLEFLERHEIEHCLWK